MNYMLVAIACALMLDIVDRSVFRLRLLGFGAASLCLPGRG